MSVKSWPFLKKTLPLFAALLLSDVANRLCISIIFFLKYLPFIIKKNKN